MNRYTLIGVSRGALLVRDYNNISNLKDGTKELVDLCRQVLILDESENVIYEYDREYMKRSKETKAIIKEAIETANIKRTLNDREKLAISRYREKWMPKWHP